MNTVSITAPPDSHSIVVERTFSATKDRVFEALTTKEKLERWWVGPGYRTTVNVLEVRSGGAWDFRQQNANGTIFRFRGFYHFVSPVVIVQTMESCGDQEVGTVSLEKTELTDGVDGSTRLCLTSVFLTIQDRDTAIRNGLSGGLTHSYDLLEEILTKTIV